MTNTKKGGASNGKLETAQENSVPQILPIQARLATLKEIQKKVRLRTAFQEHLDILTETQIEDPNEEHNENKDGLNLIKLKFGYNQDYEIKSPALLSEIRTYLVDRINTRISELDHELLNAAL